MIRLHIVAEGQTEETFVNNTLIEHLATFDVFADVRCVETSRSKKIGKTFRGGLSKYSKLKADLLRWIKEENRHSNVWFTTMIDLYALPEDFPNYDLTSKIKDPYKLVSSLEKELTKDINFSRFIPYIQLHEFEALVLADPAGLENFFMEYKEHIADLINFVEENANPELINQGKDTHPAMQIIRRIPEYEGLKSVVGPKVASNAGLTILRSKCKHFNSWLAKLEQLG